MPFKKYNFLPGLSVIHILMRHINLKTILLFSVAVILICTRCSKNENLPTEPVKINLDAAQTTVVGSGNSFAFDIFRKVLNSSESTANIMISPLSISHALSMTVNGANGATRDSMLKALRISGLTLDEINSSYKDLTDALLSVDKRVAMSIANSVWTENNLSVKNAFIDILTSFYNAESRQFDINDPAVPTQINNWISDKTNGLIKNMVDKLDNNTVMLLINAIYFKGKWQSEFDKDKTVTTSFYKPDGTISVPIMKQKSDFKIYDGNGFMLGEFPYGQGNYVMDIILPDAQNNMDAVLSTLSDASFSTWLNNLSTQKVNLSLPRFKYGYKIELKNILSGMGMGIAFTDLADLTNIADAELQITKVTHQSFIETNEEGTEAAAATISGIGVTMAPLVLDFNADHSFLYVIRESTTNTILFMGRVADPSAS
jgi:serine protease inhibitor